MTWIPLPVGVDDFEKVIRGDYYYIDKTLFIKELLDMKGEVNLFTRPRRFGKTLNMSMLRYFFEMGTTDNSELFRAVPWIKDHGSRRKVSDSHGKISCDQHFVEIHEAVLL